ncbi:hypothetical protein JCM15519_07040 [Fundidesulfovibrio butyratiphilus]
MERLIKTEIDYDNALAIIDELMDKDDRNDQDAERLEFWVTLVELYEDEHYPIPRPTPVEAIDYAMERMGLTRKDLEPYIGNKAKVSEVLSGKRPLTLPMIRQLHAALAIPLDTLAQEMPVDSEGLDWEKFPVKEMVKRGWLEAVAGAEDITAQVQDMLARAGLHDGRLAHCARASSRMGTRGDAYGILAWVSQVQITASQQEIPGTFDKSRLNASFFRGLYALSVHEDGPARARDYLAGFGIRFVVLPHLPKTYLDGAAMLRDDGTAVVGMTIRYDRVDNFWFTLGHELAHLALGHVEPGGFVVDDLDAQSQDDKERDADALASDMAIPPETWDAVPASERATLSFILHTAKALGISPAIVAGRVQNETRNFKRFSRMLGRGKVRKVFTI